jgi:hypothetical protein
VRADAAGHILQSPAALVVAHPGHELRLFRWLELEHPTVFILTDGSGRSGESRLASSLAVLDAAGCGAGSIMGRFTDRAIYQAMMERDVDAVARATEELSNGLASGGFRSVVADALELYNPTHDLCSVMASLAVRRAVRITGRNIDRFAFPVVGAPGEGRTIVLDDDAFRRKLEMAHRFDDLAVDIDELTARLGADGLRTESFFRVDPSAPLPIDLPIKPYFEQRGEEQVATGKYATVLRYREHFLPFVNALAAAVGRP